MFRSVGTTTILVHNNYKCCTRPADMFGATAAAAAASSATAAAATAAVPPQDPARDSAPVTTH